MLCNVRQVAMTPFNIKKVSDDDDDDDYDDGHFIHLYTVVKLNLSVLVKAGVLSSVFIGMSRATVQSKETVVDCFMTVMLQPKFSGIPSSTVTSGMPKATHLVTLTCDLLTSVSNVNKRYVIIPYIKFEVHLFFVKPSAQQLATVLRVTVKGFRRARRQFNSQPVMVIYDFASDVSHLHNARVLLSTDQLPQ